MHHTGANRAENRSAILQGTLDLMVLTTLEAKGPLHGYGLARRIEQISEGVERPPGRVTRRMICTGWRARRGSPSRRFER